MTRQPRGVSGREVLTLLPEKTIYPEWGSLTPFQGHTDKRVTLQSNGNGGWWGEAVRTWKRKSLGGSFWPIQKKKQTSSALQVSLAKMIIQFAHPSSKEEPDGVLSVAALLEW